MQRVRVLVYGDRKGALRVANIGSYAGKGDLCYHSIRASVFVRL